MNTLDLQIACSAAPDLASLWYNEGVAAVKSGNIHEALAAFQNLLQIAPQDAAAYNGIGICYHFLGNKAEADAAYRKAAQLDPRFARALHTTLMDRLATLYRHKLLRPGVVPPNPARADDEEEE